MKGLKRGIYVEILIRGTMDDLWQKTQNPVLHKRWDLRFTDIDYLPQQDGAGQEVPQRFLYATRIGFGKKICGEGETVGNTGDEDGQRSSALKFWSDDPKSLILKGSGYWKYIPQADGIRFLTWYEYQTRFGAIGRFIDTLLFRPLLGWATAWSFDRLRLWIEKNIDPATALRSSLIYSLARLMVAFIFLYHGLIPKLVFESKDELALMMNTGLAPDAAHTVLFVVGFAEIALGTALLMAWYQRWPLLVSIALMALALLGVAITSPAYLVTAFNPVTLNLSVIILSLIALLSDHDLPSAQRCLRTAPRDER